MSHNSHINKPTIQDLRKWFDSAKDLAKQEKALRSKAERIKKQFEQVQSKIAWAHRIAFWHKGIPISCYGGEYSTIIPDEHGIIRAAHTYLNAHTRVHYGISVITRQLHCHMPQEEWLGVGYDSEKTVKQIALDFLVDGIVPPRDERKYNEGVPRT